MLSACPGYWDGILRKPKYRNLFTQRENLARSLQLVQEVLRTVHERECQEVRRASPQPESINRVEGTLATEAALHQTLVEAYDWHLAAAQLELTNMRQLAETLGVNSCYIHSDFMEKLPIPLSGSENSDMFHGAARKTLSVFGSYTIQVDQRGRREVTATVLVSDIIELSALFGSLCVLRSLKQVKNVGKLTELILGFDSGNHFRSYENLYYFLRKIPVEKKQRTRVNYLVEKHGKAFCDSEIFSPIRRWIDEFLLHPNAFCDTEEQVVEMLRSHARREMAQNPGGTKFHIEVFNPPKPATSHTLVMDEEFITRSYSWVALPTQNKRAPVQIYNTVFSHVAPRGTVSFSVNDKTPEGGEWKKAFWMDPSWRRESTAPGQDSDLVRKYRAQMATFRDPNMVAKRSYSFDDLVARDEARLERARVRHKRKRDAIASGSHAVPEPEL